MINILQMILFFKLVFLYEFYCIFIQMEMAFVLKDPKWITTALV